MSFGNFTSCAAILYINPESWPVVGFCPHVGSTGVFGINLITLYPSFGSFKGGVQHDEPGNRTIGLYHSHLAIGALGKEGRRSPWCSEDRTRGSISAWSEEKPIHRTLHWLWHYAGEILKDFVTARIADQLSPYHDSQFSAFSTKVLVRNNRDTIAVVLPVPP